MFLNSESRYEAVLPVLKELRTKLEIVEEKKAELNAFQKCLGIPVSDPQRIQKTSTAIKMLSELWIGKEAFDEEMAKLDEIVISDIDLKRIEAMLILKAKEIRDLENWLPNNDRLSEYSEKVFTYQDALQFLAKIRNQKLDEEPNDLSILDEQVTLRDLIRSGAIDKKPTTIR